jgi:hypothetical protein
VGRSDLSRGVRHWAIYKKVGPHLESTFAIHSWTDFLLLTYRGQGYAGVVKVRTLDGSSKD